MAGYTHDTIKEKYMELEEVNNHLGEGEFQMLKKLRHLLI
jgi:hypothetical protein